MLDTAAERWSALTPAERQQWLDQRRERIEQRRAAGAAGSLSAERAALRDRAADLSPEQYAALRESGRAVSLDPVSARSLQRSSISPHPVPSRAGLSRGSGYRSAGGRGAAAAGLRRSGGRAAVRPGAGWTGCDQAKLIRLRLPDHEYQAGGPAEALRRPCARFDRFDLPLSSGRRSPAHRGIPRGGRDLVDGAVESLFVGLEGC